MTIKYLKQKEIDKQKWDRCIDKSVNRLIYAKSFYLDIVCPNWDAIVIDNYAAVMPLPHKSKFGIKYIYHPFFAQQLGLFYSENRNNNVESLLKYIPRKFVKYELSCNYSNYFKGKKVEHINHILNLNKSYNQLYKSFNTNTKRNIKKSNPLFFSKNIEVDEFINLKKANNINNLNEENFKTLKRLFIELINKKLAYIAGITDNNNLIAAAFFIEYGNRIIYLFSASSNKGKEKRAMFKIVNSIIAENANCNKILDFEGSMIDGVARFFKGFGAEVEKYFRINSNFRIIK
jgi:hypothetical protein